MMVELFIDSIPQAGRLRQQKGVTKELFVALFFIH